MTEFEALKKTTMIWYYLATHPECGLKENAYTALGLTSDVNHCPCCQYTSYSTPSGIAIDCKKCPLKKLWPYGCMKHDTSYYRWLNTQGTRAGTQAANEIAITADRVIKEEYPDEKG